MSTAAIQHENRQNSSEDRTPLPLRGDTFLGVCEAIGQDLGFNPNYLRVPFAALILWNPVAIISIYLALGGVVALTRWFVPVEKKAPVSASESPLRQDEEESEERLAA